MTLLSNFQLSWLLPLPFVYLVLYYTIPYFFPYRAIAQVPGPFWARFSNIWLASQARKGRKFAAVHESHEKYGKVVRVGYNHVSIADEKALNIVYGHGNGFLKE